MPLAPDEKHAAATSAVRRLTALEELLLGHEYPGRLHPADKLVHGKEHGVLFEEFAVQARNLFWEESYKKISSCTNSTCNINSI